MMYKLVININQMTKKKLAIMTLHKTITIQMIINRINKKFPSKALAKITLRIIIS